jgi:hypothetical protein
MIRKSNFLELVYLEKPYFVVDYLLGIFLNVSNYYDVDRDRHYYINISTLFDQLQIIGDGDW